MNSQSDSARADLARRAATDDAAWEEFITAEYQLVYWFPARLGSNPGGGGWDVATLGDWFGWAALRLRRPIGEYEGRDGASFQTFFFKVLQNKFFDWIDHVQRVQARAALTIPIEQLPRVHEASGENDPAERLLAAKELQGILARVQTLEWLQRMALLLPDLIEKVPEQDLEELAKRQNSTRTASDDRLFEACEHYVDDYSLIDLLVPVETREDATEGGRKRRRNRLQQARHRARTEIRKKDS